MVEPIKLPQKSRMGCVHLVGAGPGDPELLTIKAMRLLQSADVVVYDRLANDALLDYCSDTCQLVYVGKRKNLHSLPQEQINDLLVDLARGGRQVVRLKGGDPFIFGRGGEEIDALEQAGIPWSVVPGITAASGCGASIGVPLTHRDCAQAVTLITGHRREGELDINWDLALQEQQTVVFYMGLSSLSLICTELLKRGKAADTPFAVVSGGTSKTEVVIAGTLSTIGAMVEQANPPSPALLIMGEVIRSRFQVDAGQASLDCAVSKLVG
jgi:uroporphyrin-III C-methyltransferase